MFIGNSAQKALVFQNTVNIIHVLNIHFDLFLWVYGTYPRNYFNMNIFQQEHLLPLYH